MTLETAAATSSKPDERWLDKPVVPWWPALTIEKLLIVLLIGAVILTRFYDLGARTMSHDESIMCASYSIETMYMTRVARTLSVPRAGALRISCWRFRFQRAGACRVCASRWLYHHFCLAPLSGQGWVRLSELPVR